MCRSVNYFAYRCMYSDVCICACAHQVAGGIGAAEAQKSNAFFTNVFFPFLKKQLFALSLFKKCLVILVAWFLTVYLVSK
jgi:hypothetical protein